MLNPRDEACYGCNPKEFLESARSSLTYRLSGPGMIVMSLMSDAQEEIDHGAYEDARKTLNRAKLLVYEEGLGLKDIGGQS